MMATQNYDLPIGSDVLSASRIKYNDCLEALKVSFEGTTEPASADTDPYMRWFDTSAGLIKERNASNDGWVTVGKIGILNNGLVSLSTAGQTMTVDLDFGGTKKVTGLAAPSGANDAARKSDLDLKADKDDSVFTGSSGPRYSADPSTDDTLTRKSWTEGTFFPLAGGTLTGRIGIPATPAAGDGDALRSDEVENLTTFNTSSGHSHDGINSKEIAVSKFRHPSVDCDHTITTSWTTFDATEYITGHASALIFYLKLDTFWTTSDNFGNTRPNNHFDTIYFRANGESDASVIVTGQSHNKNTEGAFTLTNTPHQQQVIVPCNAAHEIQVKRTLTQAGTSAELFISGYLGRA